MVLHALKYRKFAALKRSCGGRFAYKKPHGLLLEIKTVVGAAVGQRNTGDGFSVVVLRYNCVIT